MMLDRVGLCETYAGTAKFLTCGLVYFNRNHVKNLAVPA
jgi:hypothetical protein